MKKPKMFRKRYIPSEVIDISNDEMIYRDNEVIITRWKPIKPRNDFMGGVSYTFLNEGYKVSRFYKENKKLMYIYCDIINVYHDEYEDEYVVTDLLIDVKIYPDSKIEVLDIDEMVEALTDRIITQEIACDSLKKLDRLLKLFYSNNFPPKICNEERYWWGEY